MAKFGIIVLNDKTAGHQAQLEALGYKVTVLEDHERKEKSGAMVHCKALKVEVEDFIVATADNAVDITTAEIAKSSLRLAVKAKKAFTYQTRFLTADGIRWGLQACRYLGKNSALIMKPESKTGAAKKTGMTADVDVADLLAD